MVSHPGSFPSPPRAAPLVSPICSSKSLLHPAPPGHSGAPALATPSCHLSWLLPWDPPAEKLPAPSPPFPPGNLVPALQPECSFYKWESDLFTWFTYSFNEHLLSPRPVPGPGLGSGDTQATQQESVLPEPPVWWRDKR